MAVGHGAGGERRPVATAVVGAGMRTHARVPGIAPCARSERGQQNRTRGHPGRVPLLQGACVCLLLLVDAAAGAGACRHRRAFCDVSVGVGAGSWRARALAMRRQGARPRVPDVGAGRGRTALRGDRPFMQLEGGGGSEDGIGEREAKGLSDLSLLGAFGKLRAGLPTRTRELPKPSRINESFEIQVCPRELRQTRGDARNPRLRAGSAQSWQGRLHAIAPLSLSCRARSSTTRLHGGLREARVR